MHTKLVGFMKFSTRTTYGLRAIICLAKNSRKSSLSLVSIAEQEKISLKYLEKIFSILKKNNIIKSEKGMAGGYYLAKKPEKLSVYDIVLALEGQIIPFHCINEGGKVICRSQIQCGASKVLVKVQSAIIQTLKNIKLCDLL
jgi:Rrf2 family protein